MDIDLMLYKQLQLTLSTDTRMLLKGMSEDALHELFILSDDSLRMSLMCMDAALLNGWKMLTIWEYSSQTDVFVIEAGIQFCVSLQEEKSCFYPNRYGQMQLHQWLQDHFTKVTIKGKR